MVLDQLNIQGQCVGLVARGASNPSFCRRAFTVQFMPCGTPDARTPNGELDDDIEDIPSGCVIAITSGGCLRTRQRPKLLAVNSPAPMI